MTRKFFRTITGFVFLITALGSAALIWLPREPPSPPAKKQQRQTKVIVPQNPGLTAEQTDPDLSEAEPAAYEERITAKTALNSGEILVSLLTANFDEDPEEEQIIAYRNLLEKDSPIYLTYIDFDVGTQKYVRLWSAPAAATRPGTIQLYMQDLAGDRTPCVILSGMNGIGEYTMTVFRKNLLEGDQFPFSKIAELRANGSISVQETQRTQAYQQGYAKGQSFSIIARSRDESSANPLDQKEVLYTFNETRGLYEQSSFLHIPGKQIEQSRLQELLNSAASFEGFIDGLWYYVSPQGTVDARQYIYFDTRNREIIFYDDEAQQIFTWQNSGLTRYGLYIATQNISVTNLRRSLDIELESLDSIRLKVSEDMRIRIGVTASWDGSYRKALSLEPRSLKASESPPSFIDAQYNGSIGTLQFSRDGFYTLSSSETNRKGKYTFFQINNYILLEFRSEKGFPVQYSQSEEPREVYLVEYPAKPENPKAKSPENITLYPVRIGTQEIQKLHKPAVFLAAYNPMEESVPPVIEEPVIVTSEDKSVPILSYSSQPQYFSPDGDGVDDELTIFLGTQSA
ncbi:MAG: pallilysin-related adhesin, partial [Spirochaetaceae bacterium]|nr:pallilysin-related adhesin [Spirochaetaceae bacterium]